MENHALVWVLVIAVLFLAALSLRRKKDTQSYAKKSIPQKVDTRQIRSTGSAKDVETLYRLTLELEKLKSYDGFANLFLSQATAIQVLFGIERECQEDEKLKDGIRTEFMNLFQAPNLTEKGFQITVPAVTVNHERFVRENSALNTAELREEIRVKEAGIKDRTNRKSYKAIVEKSGPLLYEIVPKENEEAAPSKLREDIRELSRIFRSHGIYPMYYEDFPKNDAHRREFQTGSRYAAAYPGLYRKEEGEYYLINECWGRRKAG